MSTTELVHVGDVGWVYTVYMADISSTLDPEQADIRRIIFSMPGGITLVKDADLELDVDSGSPPNAVFLTYQVTGDDGAGSPAGIFHAQEGAMRIQGYLEWTGEGSPSAEHVRFHSDVVTVDENGQELRIFPNLD